MWTISYNHFVYKTAQGDVNSDCFHVVDLKTNKTFLVSDFIQDPTCK